MKWNEDKSKEIIQKHRKRFGFRITMRIAITIIAFVMLYIGYVNIVKVIYERSNINLKIAYYTQLAIDWTNPEYTTSYGIYTDEISPTLTQTQEHLLYKRVGREDYLVSKLTVTKPLFSKHTKVLIDHAFEKEFSDKGFKFTLPFWPSKDGNHTEKLLGNENKAVWENLKMMESGNVATLAFSVDDLYTPKEIVKMLEDYDVDIIWMPLYMGENDPDYVDSSLGGFEIFSGNLFYTPQWGLAPARYTLKHWGATHFGRTIQSNNVNYTQEVMLKNMERMLEDNKNIAESILGVNNLQKRYDYLQKYGFLSFGAIVTGPVKELQKLEHLTEIRTPFLGEIRPYNWYKEGYDDDGEEWEFDHDLYENLKDNNENNEIQFEVVPKN